MLCVKLNMRWRECRSHSFSSLHLLQPHLYHYLYHYHHPLSIPSSIPSSMQLSSSIIYTIIYTIIIIHYLYHYLYHYHHPLSIPSSIPLSMQLSSSIISFLSNYTTPPFKVAPEHFLSFLPVHQPITFTYAHRMRRSSLTKTKWLRRMRRKKVRVISFIAATCHALYELSLTFPLKCYTTLCRQELWCVVWCYHVIWHAISYCDVMCDNLRVTVPLHPTLLSTSWLPGALCDADAEEREREEQLFRRRAEEEVRAALDVQLCFVYWRCCFSQFICHASHHFVNRSGWCCDVEQVA